MSLSATVEGFELQEGDQLIAYANGEIVGESLTPDPSPMGEGSIYYMSVGGEKAATVRYAIVRDGMVMATTPEAMNFSANAVVGSPDEPAVLNFVEGTPTDIGFLFSDSKEDKWFNVNGIPLSTKPTRPGVYILNGNKVVIK